MHTAPSPLGDLFAGLRDAAAARTRLSGVPGALLLLLLATLLGRLERIARAWNPEADVIDTAEDSIPLRRAALGLSPDCTSRFADAAALGIVAGWMIRAFPARGMRRVPARPSSPRHARTLPAHAPPRVRPMRFSHPIRGRVPVPYLLRDRIFTPSSAPPLVFTLC